MKNLFVPFVDLTVTYAPNQIDNEKVFSIDKLCDILIYNLSIVTINQMQSCCKRHRMLGLGVTAPSGGYPVSNSFFKLSISF